MQSILPANNPTPQSQDSGKALVFERAEVNSDADLADG